MTPARVYGLDRLRARDTASSHTLSVIVVTHVMGGVRYTKRHVSHAWLVRCVVVGVVVVVVVVASSEV